MLPKSVKKMKSLCDLVRPEPPNTTYEIPQPRRLVNWPRNWIWLQARRWSRQVWAGAQTEVEMLPVFGGILPRLLELN